MPVGGRINRKEQLRSKASVAKIQKDDDNKSEPKEDKVPGLKLLTMLKERNIARKSLATTCKINLPDTKDNVTKPHDKNDMHATDKVNEVIAESNLETSVKSRVNLKKNKMQTKILSGQEEPEKMDIEVVQNVKVADVKISKFLDVKNTPRRKTRADICNINTEDNKCDATEIDILKTKEVMTGGAMEVVEKEGIRKGKITPSKTRVLKSVNVAEPMEVVQEEGNATNHSNIDTNAPKNIETPTKTRSLKRIDAPNFMEIVQEEKETDNNHLNKPKARGRKPLKTTANCEIQNKTEIASIENADVQIDDVELYAKEESKQGQKIEDKATRVAKPTKKALVTESSSKIPGLTMLQAIKNRKSAIMNLNAEESSNKVAVIAPEVKEDKPIPRSVAALRKGKSTLDAVSINQKEETPAVLPPKVQRLGKVTATTPANAIIPGLVNTAEIKRRKTLVNTDEQLSTPELPVIEKTVATKKPTKVVLPASPKIPGFTVIEEIRNRKSAHLTPLKNNSKEEKSAVSFTNASPLVSRLPLFSGDSVLTPKCAASLQRPPMYPATAAVTPKVPLFTEHVVATPKTSLYQSQTFSTPKTAYFAGASSVAQKLSLLSGNNASTPQSEPQNSYKPFVQSQSSLTHPPIRSLDSPQPTQRLSSILRTPQSTSKRPMSCLDEEATQPRGKLARTEENSFNPNGRRSVTFSNRVQLKEIKGNSFNSESDDHEDPRTAEEAQLDKIKSDIEKTKAAIAKKRLTASHSLNNPFSMAATSTPYGAVNPPSATLRKPTLYDDKFAERKAHYKSELTAAGHTQRPYDFSNARLPAAGDDLRSRSGPLKSAAAKDISDDEMDVDEGSKDKTKCSIM